MFAWWQMITRFSDHIVRHKNVKSLYCTFETNIILYINCNGKIKNVKRKKKL